MCGMLQCEPRVGVEAGGCGEGRWRSAGRGGGQALEAGWGGDRASASGHSTRARGQVPGC